jgi:hypothetical protein
MGFDSKFPPAAPAENGSVSNGVEAVTAIYRCQGYHSWRSLSRVWAGGKLGVAYKKTWIVLHDLVVYR